MAKLTPCSKDGSAPDWMLGVEVPADADRIAGVKSNMNPDELVSAKDEIEKCAKKGQQVFVSENLPSDQRRELAEFAAAVGLPKDDMVEVKAEKQRRCQALATPAPPVVSAAAPKPIVDFDLSPKSSSNPDNFKKSDTWKTPVAAGKMSDRPGFVGVVPIRGGEQYDANPVKGVRAGENSIGSPDAIGKSIADGDKSTRDIIRAENEKRVRDTTFSRDAWQAEAAAKVSGSLLTPGICRVEAVQAQRHSGAPAEARSIKPDPNRSEMPEKSAGEKLAESNDLRRQSIQRPKGKEEDWNSARPAAKTGVSDEFLESARKAMARVGKAAV